MLACEGVMAAEVAVDGPVASAPACAQVRFLSAGVEKRAPLRSVVSVPFEEAAAVRSFPSYRGQRNFPGLWWSATSGRHVGYESWLERDQAMLLDFDPRVVGFAAQPFWLCLPDAGRSRWHAPDFFARLEDGTGVVIDCRSNDPGPGQQEVFSAVERACAEVGWWYRLAGAVDPVLAGNVRWLAGYRHPRYRVGEVADRLLEGCVRPTRLLTLAERVGDPIAVLPVLFHLLWARLLDVELGEPLGENSFVSAPVR